jgi:DNA helicase-2/ATP-dependent DNA helicase PcrA
MSSPIATPSPDAPSLPATTPSSTSIPSSGAASSPGLAPSLSPASSATGSAGDAGSADGDGLAEEDRELIAAWELDAGLLLAEREARRARGDGPVEVFLPARLSVSTLVTLARNPDELARQVRRPMPQPPARQARRGTAFHQWLEERFGQQVLIGDDDLFADDDLVEPDVNLMELKARFEAGEWGGRWPREVEVPFETQVGDRQLRGRIDAIFAAPDGGYDVVDWKTGYLPRTEAERDAVAVQLAAYRLAWADLARVPLDRVRAAFYYVGHDRTVRPADLLDADGLRELIIRIPIVS